jgi:malic enzyme
MLNPVVNQEHTLLFLKHGIIIPSIFDLSVPPMVAREVAKAAIETGVARVNTQSPDEIACNLEAFLNAQG